MRSITQRGRRNESAAVNGRPAVVATAGAVGLGVGIGAIAEYLLDPARGRARRARVRSQLTHAAHEGNSGLDALARDLTNRGRGVTARARYRFTAGSADDHVLRERVRATLGRYVSHPHAVEVRVGDGVVTLSGEVLAGEERRAHRAVSRIPGVKRTDAQWKVHRDPTGVPQLQGAGRPRRPVPELLQQHWSPTARLVAASGGATMWALSRRFPRPVSWALGGAGTVLTARAAANLPLRRLTGITAGRRAVDVQDSIAVTAPPDQVWQLLSDYGSFPRFMPDVLDVRRSTGGRWSHWIVTGPAGLPVRFDAEETRRDEGHEIAWRTIDGQLVAHSGVIRLDPETDGRTRIQVRLTYNPIVGAVGHAVATMFGADPAHKLRRDLQRLKSLAETGTAPSDASRPEPTRAW